MWGRGLPSGFDCSGFTMYVYAHFGYRMSHGASDQRYAFTCVHTAERLGGTWCSSYGGGDISHVGICIWAAPSSTPAAGSRSAISDKQQQHLCGCEVRILAD